MNCNFCQRQIRGATCRVNKANGNYCEECAQRYVRLHGGFYVSDGNRKELEELVTDSDVVWLHALGVKWDG